MLNKKSNERRLTPENINITYMAQMIKMSQQELQGRSLEQDKTAQKTLTSQKRK